MDCKNKFKFKRRHAFTRFNMNQNKNTNLTTALKQQETEKIYHHDICTKSCFLQLNELPQKWALPLFQQSPDASKLPLPDFHQPNNGYPSSPFSSSQTT